MPRGEGKQQLGRSAPNPASPTAQAALVESSRLPSIFPSRITSKSLLSPQQQECRASVECVGRAAAPCLPLLHSHAHGGSGSQREYTGHTAHAPLLHTLTCTAGRAAPSADPDSEARRAPSRRSRASRTCEVRGGMLATRPPRTCKVPRGGRSMLATRSAHLQTGRGEGRYRGEGHYPGRDNTGVRGELR